MIPIELSIDAKGTQGKSKIGITAVSIRPDTFSTWQRQ